MQLILKAPCSISVNPLNQRAIQLQNTKADIHPIKSQTCCTELEFNPQQLQVIINLLRLQLALNTTEKLYRREYRGTQYKSPVIASNPSHRQAGFQDGPATMSQKRRHLDT